MAVAQGEEPQNLYFLLASQHVSPDGCPYGVLKTGHSFPHVSTLYALLSSIHVVPALLHSWPSCRPFPLCGVLIHHEV